MKTLKRFALIMFSIMMLLSMSSMSAFAATSSPIKTSFNTSLEKKSVTYNGKTQNPEVVVKDINGKTISSKYYTVSTKTCKNVGKYKVVVTGKGKYAGYKSTMYYKITEKTQKVTVSKSSWSVKCSKKKTQSVKLTVKKSAGKVYYRLSNNNVYVKNGRLYVKKGTKKGTYSVKVVVKDPNYKTVVKYVKVVVK